MDKPGSILAVFWPFSQGCGEKASLLDTAWQFHKRRYGRSFFFLCCVFLAPGIVTGGHARAEEPVREALVLMTGSGEHTFDVELAATPAARALGLMHRKTLHPRHGMLFDFDRPRAGVAMWMKDTLIPLDMLFLGPQGRVLMLAGPTTPGSLDPIGIRAPVRAVLELPGGTAARIGARVGDQVAHRIFE